MTKDNLLKLAVDYFIACKHQNNEEYSAILCEMHELNLNDFGIVMSFLAGMISALITNTKSIQYMTEGELRLRLSEELAKTKEKL